MLKHGRAQAACSPSAPWLARGPDSVRTTMSDTRGFSVHAYGCRLALAADCEEGITVLQRYVFPSLPRTAAGDADISVRIDRSEGQFELSADGAIVAADHNAEALVPDLIRVVDEAVVQRLSLQRAVHAGVVVLGGRALLLPGKTHSGKSSLVAALLRRGATYFSDEYALIDRAGRVHPYPRPLLVRNGTPEQTPALPEGYGAATGLEPVPVGWIFSLQYQPSCDWNVAPIAQSDAMLMLLRNTPHILAESPDIVGIFQKAVAGARCYSGVRPEAAQAADEILRLAS